MAPEYLFPDWPAPASVRALQTTRLGGFSHGPFASMNLGDHVGDDPAAVAANRQRLAGDMAAAPRWLKQVHGVNVVDAARALTGCEADAAYSRSQGLACVVMTADCLPVLFCNRAGTCVAAAHAGWRGLCAGILERTATAMGEAPSELMAWLGPAIGPDAFEVGDDVRNAFLAHDAAADSAFTQIRPGKWFADIFALATQRLNRVGIRAIHGGGLCTVADPGRFFSFRRDGTTGRMASLIWIDSV